ncbi:SDR family oxidoreductase [Streptomyces sp. NPDC055299]
MAAEENGARETGRRVEFDRVVRTHPYRRFWLSKKALPHMPKGSCILNNSASVRAHKPSPRLLDHAMAKGAFVTCTQGLASDGNRVHAVAPGPVWTPLIPATLPDTVAAGGAEPAPASASPACEAAAVHALPTPGGSRINVNHERTFGAIPALAEPRARSFRFSGHGPCRERHRQPPG